MSLECSICISGFKDPVCLPCGHLYCQKCIVEHVNIPSNQNLSSTCPSCRATFQLVTPDLTYLPKKYHTFISPAIRRVYIDLSAHNSLQKKLKQAEKRLEMRKTMEEQLLKKCESLQAALNAHRVGEAEANESLDELREKLDEAEEEYQDKISALESRVEMLDRENRGLALRCRKLTTETKSMQAKIDLMEREGSATEEDDRSIFSSDSDPGVSSFFTSRGGRPSVALAKERLIKPLPKRHHPRSNGTDALNSSGSKRPRI